MGAWIRERLPKGERGASLVEYLLLVSLIAMAVIAAVILVGGELSSSYDRAGDSLSTR